MATYKLILDEEKKLATPHPGVVSPAIIEATLVIENHNAEGVLEMLELQPRKIFRGVLTDGQKTPFYIYKNQVTLVMESLEDMGHVKSPFEIETFTYQPAN